MIVLSDSENDSVQCNRAKNIKKIKRKRQEKRVDCTDESETSEKPIEEREHHCLGNNSKGIDHGVIR